MRPSALGLVMLTGAAAWVIIALLLIALTSCAGPMEDPGPNTAPIECSWRGLYDFRGGLVAETEDLDNLTKYYGNWQCRILCARNSSPEFECRIHEVTQRMQVVRSSTNTRRMLTPSHEPLPGVKTVGGD